MAKHLAKTSKADREPNYVRGFIKLMVIWGVICTAAYVTVPYWPI
jgi:hypothetical protein